MIQIETNRVYTIGAAGFWLDRVKKPRLTAAESRQQRIGRQLAEFLRMRQRISTTKAAGN